MFRDSEENNLVGAKFIDQNNTWMSVLGKFGLHLWARDFQTLIIYFN